MEEVEEMQEVEEKKYPFSLSSSQLPSLLKAIVFLSLFFFIFISLSPSISLFSLL